MTVQTDLQSTGDAPAGRLAWLTPVRCRAILAIYLLITAAANVIYLNAPPSFDLSGDEAQYWDWSRNLDLSYYSKGPLVAYLIRASCAIFGERMPAVRYPAIVLGMGTSIFAYLLTRRLFSNERIALGAALLSALTPIFIFGAVFMTIDAPLMFCWAGASYFSALAIFDQKRWAWVVVGVFLGLGFLAKYAALLWIPSVLVFVLTDSVNRRRNLTGLAIAFGVSLLFTIQVIVWNHQHGWVSLKHVAHQTGTSGGSVSRGNFFEFIGSQILVLEPVIAGFVIAGIIYTFRSRPATEPFLRQIRLLVWIGLPLFLMTAIVSLFAKAQANWPAPAYFSLLILAAYFLATRMRSAVLWKKWQGWVTAAIIIGIIVTPLARNPAWSFPVVHGINRLLPDKRHINPARGLGKVLGWRELGSIIGQEVPTLGEGAFILCDDYMQTAEAAFYTAGQPQTYCAGSYFKSDPKRLTQYDMWENRSLEPMVNGARNPLLGRNAIYVGKGGRLPPDIPEAFDRIERLKPVPVMAGGFEVKTLKLWRCYGFKGMERPQMQEKF